MNHPSTARPPLARPTPGPTAAGQGRRTPRPAAVSCSRLLGGVLHEPVRFGFSDHGKAEALPEALGRVDLEHAEAYGQPGRLSLREHLPDELRADAAALEPWQGEDPVEFDVVGQPLDRKAAHGLAGELDDLVGFGPSARDEAGVLLRLVPGTVGLLDVGPEGDLEQREEELEVFGLGDSERDLVLHVHAA